MRCKGRIFDSDLKENTLNTLNDFTGAEYLFDEYYQLEAQAAPKHAKPKKQRGKWVSILTEFDHLKDDLKKTFLSKVLSSIGVNLQDVLVHYHVEGDQEQKWVERYESSTIFIWSDELPTGEQYFEKKIFGDNALFYFPSLSNIMSDQSKKVTLWTVLKREYVSQK